MDWIEWARAVAALGATLALIGLAGFAARRLGMLQAPAGGKRRMGVVESLMLDPRRRLVIVRVDGAEHVLLLSPTRDLALGATSALPPEGEE